MCPLDTLSAARCFEQAGFKRRQAEAIASVIGRTDAQLATKTEVAALESNVESLRSEARWTFRFLSVLILAAIARLFEIV